MSFRSCRLRPLGFAGIALLVFASSSAAQSKLSAVPPPADADELPARFFDGNDGVPRGAVNRVKALRIENALWLGADEGAYRFDGRRWIPYAIPDSIQPHAVRDFAITDDGSRWMALRQGILRDSAGVQRWYPLPEAPVWTLSVTPVFDPKGSLVAATRGGLLRFDGVRFVRVPLPAGLSTRDLVLTTTTRAAIPSLWVGSLEGGLARYRQGSWTVFGTHEGVPADVRVQHLASTPAEDPAEVVVTAMSAVYEFAADHFRELRSGTGAFIRSARIVRNGRFETWISLTTGYLFSDGGVGVWRRLRPAGRSPSGFAQALSVFRDVDGSFLVFVGYRGGELVRYRIGRAEVAQMPPGSRGRTIESIFDDGHGRALVSTVGNGFYESSSTMASPPFRLISDKPEVVSILHASPSIGGGHWALTRLNGIWHDVGGRWRAEPSLLTGRRMVAMAEGPGPTGQAALVASSATGELLVRESGAWRIWSGIPFTHPVVAMASDTVDGRPVLWVALSDELWRWNGQQWTAVRMPAGVHASEFQALLPRTTAAGAHEVWVLTRDVGLLRVDGALSVPVAEAFTVPALSDRGRRIGHALGLSPDGSLLVGTTVGLLRLRVADAPRSVHVTASFTDDDGLPHSDVYAIAPASDGRRTWVGTLGGLALMDVSGTRPNETLRDLSVQLLKIDSLDTPIANGSVLPWSAREICFDFVLGTTYREDDVRYRFELTGPERLTQAWSQASSIPMRTLPDGQYRLRVWAMHGYNDPVGPIERSFRIAPPLWRSPLALVAYVFGAVALVWLVTAWRTAALRRREAVLLENEERLAESERRFRVLFEQSSDAQLLTDGRTIVAANAAAGELIGDLPDGEGLRGVDVTTVLPLLASELPDSSERMTADVRTLSGETRPVMLARSVLPQGRDLIAHVELYDQRDVLRLAREREVLEQQLRESQRLEALGTLAGGVAHDFNNLLTVIRNGAEMVRDAEQRGLTDAESLEAILHASARARDLVRQILTFSRRLPTRRDRVAVHALLTELQPMLRASLPSTIRVVVEEAAPDAEIIGDHTQLVQVLVNLATNAEYALRGRTDGLFLVRTDVVSLPSSDRPAARTLPDGDYLQIRVSDNGIGMRDEVRARVFEPFFTTKPVGDGTGLGLSVLHGIVAAHGGSVAVESTPDSGTTFDILLPLADQVNHASLAQTSAPATSTASPRVARILLADDEMMVLSATQRILVRQGYAVTACSRGEDAVRHLQSSAEFDLLITDLTMPVITGDMLARLARQLRPGLPVIMLTGFGGEVNAMARDSGVREVIAKPYELRDLLAAVGRALNA